MADIEEVKEEYEFHISAYDLENGDFNIHKNVKIVGKKVKTYLFLQTIKSFLECEIKEYEEKNKCMMS